jgi:protein-S-isoprenylcysteine O-methyltransferase Ste14
MNDLSSRLIFVAILVAMMAVRVTYDMRQSGMRSQMFDWGRFAVNQLRDVITAVMFLQLLGVEVLRIQSSFDNQIRITGLILVLIGAWTFDWSRSVRATTWGLALTKPEHIKDHFVCTTGPYRFVRHPCYGSFIFGAVGFELFVGVSWLFLLVGPVLGLQYAIIAMQEERDLLTVYGDTYKEYMARVRWRLIPRVL